MTATLLIALFAISLPIVEGLKSVLAGGPINVPKRRPTTK